VARGARRRGQLVLGRLIGGVPTAAMKLHCSSMTGREREQGMALGRSALASRDRQRREAVVEVVARPMGGGGRRSRGARHAVPAAMVAGHSREQHQHSVREEENGERGRRVVSLSPRPAVSWAQLRRMATTGQTAAVAGRPLRHQPNQNFSYRID
jgi:hypothetical protein